MFLLLTGAKSALICISSYLSGFCLHNIVVDVANIWALNSFNSSKKMSLRFL